MVKKGTQARPKIQRQEKILFWKFFRSLCGLLKVVQLASSTNTFGFKALKKWISLLHWQSLLKQVFDYISVMLI